MLKIIKNPDENKYNEVTEAVKKADGYCPCMLQKTPETKCICKVFKDQAEVGECYCGRFVKIEV